MTAAEQLAHRLVAHVVAVLEELVAVALPGFRVPGVYGGHRVGPDVRADLAFTLGLLGEAGVPTVGGVDVTDAVARVLLPIDGPATDTFSSYRVAETLLRTGGLSRHGPQDRANLAAACDSTSWVELLDQGLLPRNYAAVLARCELGRQRLGLLGAGDGDLLDDLTGRTAAVLDENPHGYLDDSSTRIGRYDIYTADLYLFTEPLAAGLGERWRRGAASALDLVERVGATNGAAVTWGRSTGALAACHTVELGALALRHGLTADAARWLALAANAAEAARGWFRDGLVTAHRHRSTEGYRGPHRRLQMTLDCLGKLVDAALSLRASGATADPLPQAGAFPPRDELVVLDDERRAVVWSYRSGSLAFVLPVVGCTVSDYLPAPRNPGLFEVPVQADLPVAVPFAFSPAAAGGTRHVGADLPVEVSKGPGTLSLRYDGFTPSGRFERDDDVAPLPGQRRVEYRVEGRTLHVREDLRFAEPPEAVAVQVAETDGRPLRVTFDCPSPSAAARVDTTGLKEWRSPWAELPVVHQLDVAPATELTFSWSVAPKLRVVTNALTHHYHRTIYDPLGDDVAEGWMPFGRAADPRRRGEALARWDVFHLHWPEWVIGPDVAAHESFVTGLRESGVRVLLTAHNLVPHSRDERYGAIYDVWAGAADAVVHHSRWGEARLRDRYRFRPDALHRVVLHPHFGPISDDVATVDRAEAEAELGLTQGKRRIGVVGAPRPEKDVASVVEGFLASGRDDLELLVLSARADEVLPTGPGVVTLPYEEVPRPLYNRRLAVLDALVLPFGPGELLTTGTVGDAVALGLPCLASDWPFLAEVLGDAAITYGRTADDLASTLRTLDDGQLTTAAAASRALRPAWDPGVAAAAHLALLEELGPKL